MQLKKNIAAQFWVTIAGIITMVISCERRTNLVEISDAQLEMTSENGIELRESCEEFRKQFGTWPPDASALVSTQPFFKTNWLVDGWDRPFVFLKQTNNPNVMWLISLGADGRQGGSGTNADIATILQ